MANWQFSTVCYWHWTLLLLLALDSCGPTLSSGSGTSLEDVATLGRIQTAWGYPFALLNWEGNDPCSEEWYGVECDSSSPQLVTGLWLGESRLYGRIPEELGDLRHLRFLSLSTNGITGEIPASLGNLTALVKLELDQNRLKGSVPSSLAGLQRLNFLNLSGNPDLTGRLLGRLAAIPRLSYDSERICGKDTDLACAGVAPAPLPPPAPPPTSVPFVPHVLSPALPTSHPEPPPPPPKKPRRSRPPPPSITPAPAPGLRLPVQKAPPPARPPVASPARAPAPAVSPAPTHWVPSPAPIALSPSANQTLSPCGGADGQSWDCMCDGGQRGFQTCPVDGSFLGECQCPADCAPCPFGLVRLPSKVSNCLCVRPAVIRARLFNLSFHSFTPTMELVFLSNLARKIRLKRNQLFAVHRSAGSVIVNVLVVPLASKVTLSAAEVSQMRTALAGSLNDPLFGPFDVQIMDDGITPLTPNTAGPTSSPPAVVVIQQKKSKGTLLLATFIVCIVATVLALTSALFCIVSERRKGKNRKYRYPKGLDRDDSLFQRLTSNSLSHSGDPCAEPAGGMGPEKREATPGTRARVFSYFELDEATSGFDRRYLIGSGGTSSVYRGRLPGNKMVAVKMLHHQQQRTSERPMGDFAKEVAILSRLHHVNLVELIGYARHGNERFLVYEYMRNGTLREHLTGNSRHRKTLTWEQRAHIALGAARGLEYLHESANPRILHRDFKSTNILLDNKLRAKVADFGMAKEDSAGSGGSSPALTQVLGTFGYFAPEYSLTGKASSKSDIFSFGVVLLELITGRQPVDSSRPEGEHSLVLWANPMLLDEKLVLSELADSRLKGKFPPSAICRMSHVAWACLQADPERRPGMTEVVACLKDLLPRQRAALRSLSFSTWADDLGGPSGVGAGQWVPGGGVELPEHGESSKRADEKHDDGTPTHCASEIEPAEPSPSRSSDLLDSPSQGTVSLSFGNSLPCSPALRYSQAPASPGAYTGELLNQEDSDASSHRDPFHASPPVGTDTLDGSTMYLVPL